MADKVLNCRDCGESFDFSEDEQGFYRKMNFSEPKRCPDCRKAKRDKKKQEA